MTAVLILIVILLLAIAVAVLAWRVVNLQRRLDRADARQKAAVNTSRSVHVGKITEQLAPLLPGFPYNPKDVQWVGGTIDAIVWDGLEEKRDDLDIVFLDVKTGQSRLNDRQRRVRDAAEAGRLRFEVFRPETGIIQNAADVPVAEVPPIGR
jgi:predicted Holliday junction resolvase-like endonuclease